MRQTEAKSTPRKVIHPTLLSVGRWSRAPVRVCDKSGKTQKHTYKFHNSWSWPTFSEPPFTAHWCENQAQGSSGALCGGCSVATSRWKPLKVHTTHAQPCHEGVAVAVAEAVAGQRQRSLLELNMCAIGLSGNGQRFKDNQLHSVCMRQVGSKRGWGFGRHLLSNLKLDRVTEIH